MYSLLGILCLCSGCSLSWLRYEPHREEIFSLVKLENPISLLAWSETSEKKEIYYFDDRKIYDMIEDFCGYEIEYNHDYISVINQNEIRYEKKILKIIKKEKKYMKDE